MSRRTYFYVIRLALALLLIFVLLEVGLRLIDFDYANNSRRTFIVEPDIKVFIPHPQYGFAMQPGQFHINQADQLKWISTHDENGYRITTDSIDTNKPEIWIFGCSFTYGWGVNDNETYPWLLQDAIPEYTIRNYGVGAYGTLQSLLQLQDELATGKKPTLVLLAYLPFHDQRNTGSRLWTRVIASHEKLTTLQYPYARIKENKLTYSSLQLVYRDFPGNSWSRTSQFVELVYNALQDMQCHNQEVTALLLEKIKLVCANNNVPLLLCALDNSLTTQEAFNALSTKGFKTLDIGLDLSSPQYTFLPIDPHPNQVAHKHYADELTNYLKTVDLQ